MPRGRKQNRAHNNANPIIITHNNNGSVSSSRPQTQIQHHLPAPSPIAPPPPRKKQKIHIKKSQSQGRGAQKNHSISKLELPSPNLGIIRKNNNQNNGMQGSKNNNSSTNSGSSSSEAADTAAADAAQKTLQEKSRNEIMDHPLLPYILKANNDLRGDNTPYTPIPEVWQSENENPEITSFLLDYLKLAEIQVNRVDKLVESAQEYCDRMLETFPASEHITKKETVKKRKKKPQQNVNIAAPPPNPALLAYGFPPMFAHPMATPEALMQNPFFQNPMLMNPNLAYNSLLTQFQPNDSQSTEEHYVNIEENLDCINTELTKTD